VETNKEGAKEPVRPIEATPIEATPSEATPSEATAASRPQPNALLDLAAEEVHIGYLRENEVLSPMRPSEYCLDDGKLWKGAKYRLGDLNVFGVDTEHAALVASNPVAVFGAKRKGLDSVLREAGPCPSPYEPVHVQMRSDWVPPERGPNTTRAHLATLAYIEGSRVQAIHMAEFLEGDATTAIVRLRNPFVQSFSDLKVEAHYEGGPGKPVATMVEQVMAIEPGEWAELRIPRSQEPPGPRTKAGSGLHSLELSGRIGKAEIDITLVVPHISR
jgi:hypothetical protein